MTLPFRLLALDLDGTLINSQFEVSARDLAALRRAYALGIEVVICTGRRHTFAMPIAQLLGFDLWMCSSNGAITRSTNGETFHRDLLPAETARNFCRYFADFRAGMVLTFDQETAGALVVEHQNWLASAATRWVLSNATYIAHSTPIQDAITSDPVQAMVCGPLSVIRRLEAMLPACPFVGRISHSKTEYPHRDLSILDFLNAGCSKGRAIERWMSHRRLTRGDVMAIGDNHNDLEMLEAAGLPVVMGNAPAELKRPGWMVTGTNDQSGVAQALESVLGAELLDLPPLEVATSTQRLES